MVQEDDGPDVVQDDGNSVVLSIAFEREDLIILTIAIQFSYKPNQSERNRESVTSKR